MCTMHDFWPCYFVVVFLLQGRVMTSNRMHRPCFSFLQWRAGVSVVRVVLLV